MPIPSHRTVRYILLGTYALLGAGLVSFFRYTSNPDGLAYLFVAKEYAAGDFANAVTGHWSPLLSWTLIPFLKAHIPAILALKIHNLITGFFTLIGAYLIVSKLSLPPGVRIATELALMILFLSVALLRSSGDLLMFCLVVFYLNILFDERYAERRYAGAACGALGALAYLAKAYAMPFFCVHFPVINLLHWLRCDDARGKKNVAISTALGIAVFAVVSLPWIAVLSVKYHGLTISTAGRYGWGGIGPDTPGEMSDWGFLPPAGSYSLSAWDDPSRYPLTTWNPFESARNFNHCIRVIARNAWRVVIFLENGSLLAIPIILAAGVILWARRRRWMAYGNWMFPWITIVLFVSGYILMDVCEQYLDILTCLVLILGAQVLAAAMIPLTSRAVHYGLLIFFTGSFLIFPVTSMIKKARPNEDIKAAADAVAKMYGAGGRIASHNMWRQSMHFAHFLNAQYYGSAQPHYTRENDAEIDKRLRDFGVDYYLVWGDVQPLPGILDGRRPMMIPGDGLPPLKVYVLK